MPDIAQPFDGIAGQMAQAGWYRDAPMREGSHVYGTPPSGISGGNPVATYSSGDLALAINGLGWSMALGRAHVRGMYYERTSSPATGASNPNTNATLPRIDRLVLRRDLGAAAAADKCKPVLLQGTPASSPAVPTLQLSEDGQWDMPLYRWVVQPGSSTVLTDIRDERRWAGTHGTPIGPRIAGTLVRSDGTNNINAGDFTALQALASEALGAWRVYNVGTGLGWENDIPGWYRLRTLTTTAIAGARYEQIDCVSGTATGLVAVGGSGVSGFGGCGGDGLDILAPNGLQFVLREYNSGPAGSAGASFRAGTRWSAEWLRPVG